MNISPYLLITLCGLVLASQSQVVLDDDKKTMVLLQELIRWTGKGTLYIEAAVDMLEEEDDLAEGSEREAYKMELFSDIGYNGLPIRTGAGRGGRQLFFSSNSKATGYLHNFLMDQCKVVGARVQGETLVSDCVPPLNLPFIHYEPTQSYNRPFLGLAPTTGFVIGSKGSSAPGNLPEKLIEEFKLRRNIVSLKLSTENFMQPNKIAGEIAIGGVPPSYNHIQWFRQFPAQCTGHAEESLPWSIGPIESVRVGDEIINVEQRVAKLEGLVDPRAVAITTSSPMSIVSHQVMQMILKKNMITSLPADLSDSLNVYLVECNQKLVPLTITIQGYDLIINDYKLPVPGKPDVCLLAVAEWRALESPNAKGISNVHKYRWTLGTKALAGHGLLFDYGQDPSKGTPIARSQDAPQLTLADFEMKTAFTPIEQEEEQPKSGILDIVNAILGGTIQPSQPQFQPQPQYNTEPPSSAQMPPAKRRGRMGVRFISPLAPVNEIPTAAPQQQIIPNVPYFSPLDRKNPQIEQEAPVTVSRQPQPIHNEPRQEVYHFYEPATPEPEYAPNAQPIARKDAEDDWVGRRIRFGLASFAQVPAVETAKPERRRIGWDDFKVMPILNISKLPTAAATTTTTTKKTPTKAPAKKPTQGKTGVKKAIIKKSAKVVDVPPPTDDAVSPNVAAE